MEITIKQIPLMKMVRKIMKYFIKTEKKLDLFLIIKMETKMMKLFMKMTLKLGPIFTMKIKVER